MQFVRLKKLAGNLLAVGGAAVVVALFLFAFRYDSDLQQPVRRRVVAAAVEHGDPFPRTITDYYGDALTLERAPQRIASQALTIDHFLLATVPPGRIVAMSNYARDERYSFAVQEAQRADAVVATDVEAVVLRDPEVMLISHSARADQVDLARSAGIPVIRLLTIFDDFDEIAEQLEAVGRVTGEDEKARAAVAQMRRRVAAAKAMRPADAKPVRILALTVYSSSYGKGSLFDYIVNELGAVNVGTEQGLGPYGQISAEQVASWNPDWIVAGAENASIEEVRQRMLKDTAVLVTEAGRTGQVLVVKNREFLTMSHHAVELMESLARAIYGETK
ncbi:MAG: ABC transporter substrate-binding protein [Acidobacteria bacterium]|nr:ABC transporter substrate-binding protein [Acidobacteriota bacterium]